MPKLELVIGVLLLLCCAASLVSGAVTTYGEARAASKWPIDSDVRSLVKRMTLEEKVGQMIQIDISTLMVDINAGLELNMTYLNTLIQDFKVGSFLNSPSSGGPNGNQSCPTLDQWRNIITTIQKVAVEKGSLKMPIVYGLDTVHGAHYVYGATIFPQQLGLAATFNTTYAYQCGVVGGKDTRAAGIPWTFSPILGVFSHQAWPRTYETFGEDPLLASLMGEAIIKGYQGTENADLSRLDKVAACMKHFIAYPNPLNGQDRGPVTVTTHELYDIYVPSFDAAINKANVRSGMSAYHALNGQALAASKQYLTDLLRTELKFDGMLVTDYLVIDDLYQFHQVVPGFVEAAEVAMQQTSIDMNMAATQTHFFGDLTSLVKQGKVHEARVDESVERIVQMKKDLGLLQPDFMDHIYDPKAKIGTQEDRDMAVNAGRESVILLQNNGSILPIDLQGPSLRVLITGPGSNSAVAQSGGWTIHWQGARSDSEFAYKTTVLDAATKLVKSSAISLTWSQGLNLNYSNSDQTIPEAVAAAKSADVVVVVLAERPYAEAPGDIPDITFDSQQTDFLAQIQAVGKPVVLVIFEGRARILPPFVYQNSKAVVLSIYPGPDGGIAVAETLFGVNNPSGRLPLTYPKYINQVPYTYRHKASFNTLGGPLWEFGSGMSYSNIAYSNLRTNGKTYKMDTDFTVTVSIDVSNQGSRDAKETILVFLEDNYRILEKEAKLLKAYRKVPVPRGSKQTLTFDLQKDDFMFTNWDGKKTIEAGTFTVRVGVGSQEQTTIITLV